MRVPLVKSQGFTLNQRVYLCKYGLGAATQRDGLGTELVPRIRTMNVLDGVINSRTLWTESHA